MDAADKNKYRQNFWVYSRRYSKNLFFNRYRGKKAIKYDITVLIIASYGKILHSWIDICKRQWNKSNSHLCLRFLEKCHVYLNTSQFSVKRDESDKRFVLLWPENCNEWNLQDTKRNGRKTIFVKMPCRMQTLLTRNLTHNL